MTWTAPTCPPEPDELEVSLFGPGFGECVVAHLGWGDWIIVDSCVAPDGRTPAALAYLRGVGIDPSRAVRCVIATHWHNDHVRGLSQTMQECTGAKFICSGAFFNREFLAFTDLWKRQASAVSPVSELTGVMEAIARSPAVLKGGTGDCPMVFAMANRCLWRRSWTDEGEDENDISAELHALSPSDSAMAKSLEDISALFQTGDTLTRPSSPRPNRFSVVLWLNVAGTRCLLGADMEEQNSPFGGWRLIVDSPERPAGEASLFKVPHHGSANGECPAVWDRMLLRKPVAMLAPFRSGRVKLPTPEDAARICARTPEAFITAGFRERSSRGRSGSVNRTIHETVRYIRRVNDSFGLLRARRRLVRASEGWTVATFGEAMRLSELHA